MLYGGRGCEGLGANGILETLPIDDDAVRPGRPVQPRHLRLAPLEQERAA